MNVIIGVTIREEMRDVGVNNEAHSRDNRKRKKMGRRERRLFSSCSSCRESKLCNYLVE